MNCLAHYTRFDYRFGFNGMEGDNELKGEGNSNSTFFRQHDPRLGRWLSIDPKVHTSPWESPYVSMGGNPIWFNDPLGDKFDPASQKKVDSHKGKTESLISSLDKKINKLEGEDGLSKKQQSNLDYYKESKGELSNALTEIGVLEASDQMYTIRDYGKAGGLLSYDPSSDVIYVNVDALTSTLAHELKHAYQFEKHQVSFASGEDGEEWGGGYLYDVQDEVEAFRRQFSYDRFSINYPEKGARANKFSDITPGLMKKIGYDLSLFPGGIDGNSNAFDSYKVKSGGTELDVIYKTKTALELIREQNKINIANGAGLWEKIK